MTTPGGTPAEPSSAGVPLDPGDRDVWWYEVGFHDGRLVGRDEAFREVLTTPRVSDDWLPADAMARQLGESERPR